VHSPRRHRLGLPLGIAACCTLFAACSGSDAASEATPAASASAPVAALPTDDVGDETTDPTEAPLTQPTDTTPVDTSSADTQPMDTTPADTQSVDTSAATGPLDPLDDLDEDGTRDETCGTIDLGAGLVVDTLCDTGLVPTPEEGVVPTAASLLLLPTPTRWDDLADVDATVRVAGTPDGGRAVIYVLGSDTLFDSGSSTVRSTATPPLDAIVASITTRFPGPTVEVRGAADSVGEPAANQTLSEQRAAAVAAELVARGLPAGAVTSIGLGELVPVAEETTPDGSVSEIGRQVNRRVEIVVRLAP
jgi:outer membrane protein OmpA-like peptidoglycan-associated protein